MGNQLRERDRLAVPLPITENARSLARQFAQAQPTTQKAEQVQLNTLAVWVTHNYCQMMGIPNVIEQSDSWNPLMQMMGNVADLVLPGIGQLECRPIKTDSDTCIVPPEVWDLRVGYVVIEIDHDCQIAKLLGFTPTVTGEQLWVSQLQPPEDLLDHLHELRQLSQMAAPDSRQEALGQVTEAAVNLSQWLNHTFEASWQAVETLLIPNRMSLMFSFRSARTAEQTETDLNQTQVSRAKLIELAVNLGPQQVVLVVDLKQSESDNKTHIGLKVHPVQGQSYLPPTLELAMLDSSNTVFREVKARQADNYIQFRFRGKPGGRFKVRIKLNDACYQEEFVV